MTELSSAGVVENQLQMEVIKEDLKDTLKMQIENVKERWLLSQKLQWVRGRKLLEEAATAARH